MPPKPSNHAQFPVHDPDNEVICPITQANGTGCRKRCLGEKRFRSMQEHIRRAHPEYYIPKLPATKESFELMVNSPPHEIPKPDQPETWSPPSERREKHYLQKTNGASDAGLSYLLHDPSFELQRSFDQGRRHTDGLYGSNVPPTFEAPKTAGSLRRGSLLPAAAALAQLHYAKPEGAEWDGNAGMFNLDQDAVAKQQTYFIDAAAEGKNSNFNDPTLSAQQQFLDQEYRTDHLANTNNSNGNGVAHADPISSSIEMSPPNRAAAPVMQRSFSKNGRSKKSSVSEYARMAKHERRSSKDYLRPNTSSDRKPSAEPTSAAAVYGKRWEDLIDAATSATEEDARDRTPVPASPFQSPRNVSRTPMPAPFAVGAQFQQYTASPLQQALTPPPPEESHNLDLQPFPTVEEPSSIDSNASGANFHIMASTQALSAASDSSPMFSTPVQIYCAGCRRLSILKDSFACPECICGLCPGCVDALLSEQSRGRNAHCPRCRNMNGQFKPFQLDIR